MGQPIPPEGTYVGLYGSHTQPPWRPRCIEWLQEANVPWYDPTDEGWQGIGDDNGDERQADIDRLVAVQHQGMIGAACVVYYLGADKAHNAARCELGFLTGRGIRTFAYVDPTVIGRNYLWAQMKPYPHMTACPSLEEAVRQAIAFRLGMFRP